jgi:hypothetical protein
MGEDFDAGMPNPHGSAVRKAERVVVNAEVALRRSGQLNYRVQAYDVSPLGCKLEFVERPELAERVWVKFEGLDAIEGHICWIDGFVVGVEFERPIYQPVFDALIPRLL